jgi:hypothetical protein
MKQIIQNLKTGETILEELPAPQVKAGQVLIQTSRSLVSLGSADYKKGEKNIYPQITQICAD